MKKPLRLGLIYVCITAILITLILIYSQQNILSNGVTYRTPKPLMEFNLTDNHSHTFTKANLQGHWTLLFFGFTHCESFCPTTLNLLNRTLAVWKKELPKALWPTIVFVSIDPDRDSIEKINRFVTAVNPDFIGVRGQTKDLLAFQQQFSVQASNSGKDLIHSTEIFLINPQGQIQAYFKYPQQAARLISDYQALVSKKI